MAYKITNCKDCLYFKKPDYCNYDPQKTFSLAWAAKEMFAMPLDKYMGKWCVNYKNKKPLDKLAERLSNGN